ncbi:hypothetical protein [Treponema sp. UBA3813]|uniref:hypothetical protein n=1 Tax=Treponema sp. UBA3813 TaxID=1947715 RepID=UPI0025FEDC92|nr:hypothetical protein [Treponema sp. UBA3813]
MIKKLLFILSILFLFSSCASDSTGEFPLWVSSDWKNSFPDSEYLSSRGISSSAELSKTEALSQIARYINTSVNSNLLTSVRSINKGGEIDESTLIQNDVAVSSQVSLFGVEFTEPYYFKSEKKWYCVAYINRNKAWEQYVPKIEDAKNSFYGFYNEAQGENEPIFVIGYYKKALEKGKDFLTALEYGRLIHPAKEKQYSSDRNLLARIPSLIESEKQQVNIAIKIEGDYNEIIKTSLEKAFKNAGFSVSQKGIYSANVLVKHNSDGKEPLAVFPSIDLTISGVEKRTVYSYKERISERTVAFSLESAQKKSYPKLASKIEDTLPRELKEFTESN